MNPSKCKTTNPTYYPTCVMMLTPPLLPADGRDHHPHQTVALLPNLRDDAHPPPCCLEMHLMLMDVTTTSTRLWPYYPTCMMMLTPPCCLEMHLLMDVTTTPTRLCMKKMARRP